MQKKKRGGKSKTPKKGFIWQIFGLGILLGFSLHWIPFDQEFSSVNFSKTPFSPSPFQKILPTTSPLLQKNGFVVSYNGQTRNPNWVYHKLTPTTLEQKNYRLNCDFHEDTSLPELIRSTKSDYLGAGFDRGHLCPAADCESEKSTDDSFLLSNISPQVPSFNRGHWKKLENHVRELTKKFSAVHVFSGPLYLCKKGSDGKNYVKYQVIGSGQIAVPTHFFMLIFVEDAKNKILGKSYILPNQLIDSEVPLSTFSAPIEEIERASGILYTQILQSS